MRKIGLVFFFFFLFTSLFAQVESPGKPWSRDKNLTVDLQPICLPPVTPVARNKFLKGFPDRLKSSVFAYPIQVTFSSVKHGYWDILDDGSRIWRLLLESEGASSVNLIFSRFHLPEGAAMYLYTPDYSCVRGAFTRSNETSYGILPTTPIPGDQIVVEIDLPYPYTFLPEVEIMQVGHGFKDIPGITGTDYSGTCNVDINCPAGADWQIEKRAVVKFIRGGTLLCSGALINNTANNGRPLLLTANHCIDTELEAQQSVFYFRYEKPDCGSGTATTQYSLSGSVLLSTINKLDFSLVELNSEPPKSYEPYYAGWDRKVVSYYDTVSCIHHPSGDVKKISKSFHRVVTGDFGGGYDANTHWLVSQWDLGTTEGGSSGSPLFNSDHRIIGELTGGDASCEYNFNDYFQKLSVSWDKYPDSSDQLKYWLDPAQTGVMVLNGYDPYSGGKPLANFDIRPSTIYTGKRVYLTDQSSGTPVSWEWSLPGADTAFSAAQEPGPVVYNQPGLYTIALKVQNPLGSDSLRQTIKVIEYPDDRISENRIVPGRSITLSEVGVSEPLAVTWSILGASREIYSGLEPKVVTLYQTGEYSVSLDVEYREKILSLIHYNRIQVIPSNLIGKPHSFSNFTSLDHSCYLSLGNAGYFPGSNNQHITAYADQFSKTGDTSRIITGITIALEKLNIWDSVYYLPVIIWDSAFTELHRDSVRIDDRVEGSRITCWFRSPVPYNGTVYAGYRLKPWDSGTFCSRMAVDRGSKGLTSAYALKNGEWLPATDLAGIHTSLDISLETAYYPDTYDQEIRIEPNSNNGTFRVNLGHLVFSSVNVSAYNLKGQKIMTDQTCSGNILEFRIKAPVSGIYLVTLRIDDYHFTKKVLMLGY